MSLNTTVPANIDDNYAVPSLAIESISNKEDKANKGTSNGYAPLDATAKVPSENLPVIDVSGQIATHNADTTAVHGIANTANLVLTNDARILNIAGGSINTSAGVNNGDPFDGGSINTSAGGSINTSNEGGSINTSGSSSGNNGGSINTSGGDEGVGGSINTSNGGGSISTRGTGSIELGAEGQRTTLVGSASGSNKTITLPNATGTLVLASQAIAFAIALG